MWVSGYGWMNRIRDSERSKVRCSLFWEFDKECSPRFSKQFQIFILSILKILFILSLLLPERP